MLLERRPIHIHLTKDVFLSFKNMCAEDRVTMQEVVEYFVNGVVDDRQEMKSLFKELVQLKKERKIKRISNVESDELFNIISSDER